MIDDIIKNRYSGVNTRYKRLNISTRNGNNTKQTLIDKEIVISEEILDTNGKTVLLKALQQLNKPDDIQGFDILRDYPRSMYNDITTKKVDPKDVNSDIRVLKKYFTLHIYL